MRLEKLAKLAFRFPNNVQPLERRLECGLLDGRKRQSGYNVSFSEVRRVCRTSMRLLTLYSAILEGVGILIFKTSVSSQIHCKISLK